MADREITCITHSGAKTDCTCITHVGRWSDISRFTTQEAVLRIQNHSDTFWVRDPTDGSRVNVHVAERQGRKYLRTASNDTSRDNLLQRPTC